MNSMCEREKTYLVFQMIVVVQMDRSFEMNDLSKEVLNNN